MMEPITLELTTMAHGGAALGRHDNQVVFVPYALPGETVRAEITEDRGSHAFARLVEILAPSPERIAPPCPYFGATKCGGCQWQFASYQEQLRLKANIVTDQLVRIGGLVDPPVQPTLPDGSGWAFRNHAQFRPAPTGGLGFRTAASHDVIAIDECLVLHPLLSELYSLLDIDLEGLTRLSLRAGTATGDRMLVFETTDDMPPALEIDLPVSCVLLLSDGVPANLIGSNYVTEVVLDQAYRISAPSFFQVNTLMATELVCLILEFLDLKGGETILDAYCGVGLFTVQLAKQAGLVLGIEQAPTAVDDLLENTSGLDNVEVVEGPVEEALPDLDLSLDAAVLDPPRAGVDRFALDALADLHPGRIVYVSCDPATLARDTKRLGRKGYVLAEVQPVDMFPQTYHIESVALFTPA